VRKTYRVLAYIIVAEVVIQAMAIAFALAGLGHWIDNGHTLTKQIADSHPTFDGSVGFPIHAINGEMLVPLLVIALLVVSFFAQVPDGTKFAAIIFGMVVVQVILGVSADAAPPLILLHVPNAFGILAMAFIAARKARDVKPQQAM
jgi:hypothetical protein